MSFDLNPKIITEIKKITEKYAISKIVLFGSRARGDNNTKSDIDLAIYTLPKFTNKGNFAADIEDLETLLKIDTVFINSDTDEKLIKNIQIEGVVLYERL
ncbi:MAG TPA: nucleotidyltransferase domain-containing protein [Ruminiclostridium sp.]